MAITPDDSNPAPQQQTPKHQFTRNIALEGQGVSDTGERFIKLKIQMPSGSVNLAVEIDNLAKTDARDAMCLRLNQLGAHLIAGGARSELFKRIQDEGPRAPSFRVATKVGWVAGVFVRPDRVVGVPDQPLEVHLGGIKAEFRSKYRVSHSRLKDWKEIPKLASGNSRFMMALAMAFVGPLG